MVKNPPANAGDRRDAGWIPGQVGSPGQEDPLEKETATHSSIHLENPMDRGAWGRKKLDTTEQLSTHA